MNLDMSRPKEETGDLRLPLKKLLNNYSRNSLETKRNHRV